MVVLLPSLTATGWVLYSPYQSAADGLGYSRGNDDLWQGPSSFNLSEVALLWSHERHTSEHGLAGGITWALAPTFCEALLPHFPEQNLDSVVSFLSCSDVRNAVAAAFRTWSLNHPRITFYDVTDTCAMAPDFECASAEILFAPDATLDGARAAVTRPSLTSLNHQPVLTSGARLAHGLGLRSARIDVSTQICWYLDATFCCARAPPDSRPAFSASVHTPALSPVLVPPRQITSTSGEIWTCCWW